MNARSHAIAIPLLLVATTLVASGPATAIYLVTPLTLTPSTAEADVGDSLDFQIAENPEDEGPSYAGATVKVQYSYDPDEGQEQPSSGENPDAPVSSDDQTPPEESRHVFVDVAEVALDDAENGSFAWTVPAEVDDRNVFINLLAADGQTLATAHVRVGDAEPLMMLMAGSGAAENDIDDTPPADDTDGETPTDGAPAVTSPAQDSTAGGGDARSDTPGPGLLGALVAAAVAIALVARRR